MATIHDDFTSFVSFRYQLQLFTGKLFWIRCYERKRDRDYPDPAKISIVELGLSP